VRIVVVGKGGREHALALALARHHDVIVTPGNDGMSLDVEVSNRGPSELAPELVVIGPEAPLVTGLADELRARGIPTFGPGARGAMLEGSKVFLKEIAIEAGVPTAAYGVARTRDEAERLLVRFGPPYVIKTDGLAEGKGVLVTRDLGDALADAEAKLSGAAFGEAGKRLVIEEALRGRELSVFAVANGRDAVLVGSARDYKRLRDGDLGPNTGGMGSISPVPEVDWKLEQQVLEEIIRPTLATLSSRGIEYRGVLYAGLMLTEGGPKLIEFNVRFGDPEAEALLPLVASDLGELCRAAALGEPLPSIELQPSAAATVVIASEGYPLHPEIGRPVSGIEEARAIPGVQVCSAALLRRSGRWVTSGGRVLAVTGIGRDLSDAVATAYRAVDCISLEGAELRRDIGS
jgi:phosphoribosylamine--glycine ligase